MEFPDEILLMIFNHLDTGNLKVAGQVCKRWADIVQIFHDEARVDDRISCEWEASENRFTKDTGMG